MFKIEAQSRWKKDNTFLVTRRNALFFVRGDRKWQRKGCFQKR